MGMNGVSYRLQWSRQDDQEHDLWFEYPRLHVVVERMLIGNMSNIYMHYVYMYNHGNTNGGTNSENFERLILDDVSSVMACLISGKSCHITMSNYKAQWWEKSW